MVKNAIKVYGRIKPVQSNKEIGERDIREEIDNQVLVLSAKSLDYGINNKPETYTFRFCKIFEQDARQNDVFDVVARPVVESVLQGYNGTVFAYGQTGSGKTFTITGGANRYEDRGLIPRTIQHVFKTAQKSGDVIYNICVSYIEIYNENGYDLLDPKHQITKLEDLPRISFLEDTYGNLHIRNLSLHPVATEEEAFNLLFLGDNNRAIAETPMNPSSSRSHCVFTVHMAIRGAHSSTIRRSKMHLVDLAGSERVHKTGTGMAGRTLAESRYINLSLHFLEHVIKALSERGRSHVPYRNSMMTSLLRDSLGGNCLTSMIATLSIEADNIQETMSTCRFAQRVALVNNDARLNEEQDPQQEIAALRVQIKQLKDQIVLLSGEELTEELTDEEYSQCQELVHRIMEDETLPNLPIDLRKIKLCFTLLKESVNNVKSEQVTNNEKLTDSGETRSLEACKQLISQRNNEIGILISLLRKERTKGINSSSHMTSSSVNLSARSCASDELCGVFSEADINLSLAEVEALKVYSADSDHRAEIDYFRRELKRKYSEAKNIAEEIKASQEKIVNLRKEIEKCQAVVLMSQFNSIRHKQEVESNLQDRIEEEQSRYRNNLIILRNLKSETDHLKHGAQQAKLRLFHKFQDWWARQNSDKICENETNIYNTESYSLNQTDSSYIDKSDFSRNQLDHEEMNKIPKCLPNQRQNFTLQNSERNVLDMYDASHNLFLQNGEETNHFHETLGQTNERKHFNYVQNLNTDKDLLFDNVNINKQCISVQNVQEVHKDDEIKLNFTQQNTATVRSLMNDDNNVQNRFIRPKEQEICYISGDRCCEMSDYSRYYNINNTKPTVNIPLNREEISERTMGHTNQNSITQSVMDEARNQIQKSRLNFTNQIKQNTTEVPHYANPNEITSERNSYRETLCFNNQERCSEQSNIAPVAQCNVLPESNNTFANHKLQNESNTGLFCDSTETPKIDNSKGLNKENLYAKYLPPEIDNVISYNNNAMCSPLQHTGNLSHSCRENFGSLEMTDSSNAHTSSPTHQTDSTSFLDNIPLTGDKELDEEIMAFYMVKHRALQQHQQQR